MKTRTKLPSVIEISQDRLRAARHIFLPAVLLFGFAVLAPLASAQAITIKNVGQVLINVCVFEERDRVRLIPISCWALRANDIATWKRNDKSKFHIRISDYDWGVVSCGRDVAGDAELIEVADKPCVIDIVPRTVVRFCNDNADKLYVAFAYWLGKDKGWTSKGWHDVEARKCLDVTISYYAGDIYYYAADDGDGRWTGDTTFCVHWTKGFQIANSDKSSCQGTGYRRVGMSKLAVKPGITTQRLVP